jgi:hypothetical protein
MFLNGSHPAAAAAAISVAFLVAVIPYGVLEMINHAQEQRMTREDILKAGPRTSESAAFIGLVETDAASNNDYHYLGEEEEGTNRI